MQTIMEMARKLAYAMHVVSGFFLIAMMVTVLLDVITRSLFGMTEGSLDLTFIGGVEIVSYSLLFTILFALPHSIQRGQVIVDLFTEQMSERLKSILAGVYTLGFGMLGLGMTIRFYEAVGRLSSSGETTQDLLIPMSYLFAMATFAVAVLALRGLLVALQQFLNSGRSS